MLSPDSSSFPSVQSPSTCRLRVSSSSVLATRVPTFCVAEFPVERAKRQAVGTGTADCTRRIDCPRPDSLSGTGFRLSQTFQKSHAISGRFSPGEFGPFCHPRGWMSGVGSGALYKTPCGFLRVGTTRENGQSAELPNLSVVRALCRAGDAALGAGRAFARRGGTRVPRR
jgi:hypothetical protein